MMNRKGKDMKTYSAGYRNRYHSNNDHKAIAFLVVAAVAFLIVTAGVLLVIYRDRDKIAPVTPVAPTKSVRVEPVEFPRYFPAPTPTDETIEDPTVEPADPVKTKTSQEEAQEFLRSLFTDTVIIHPDGTEEVIPSNAGEKQ